MTNLKKALLFALFLGVLVLYSTSCSQSEEVLEEVTEEVQTTIDEYRINPTPLSALMVNAEDREDERVQKAMTKIAEALKLIVQQPIYTDYILAEARKTDYDAVLLSDFIAHFRETEAMINEQLSTGMRSSALEDLIAELVYENIEYDPVIHVANLSTADTEKMPILSPGVEALDDDEAGVDDHYVFWYFHQNGAEYEVTVSEEQANSEDAAPAFVLSLLSEDDTENLEAGTSSTARPMPEELTARSNHAIHSHEFRIDQRYDNNKRSEFYVGGRVAYNNTIYYFGDENGRLITKVHKNDIGDNLTRWHYWFHPDDFPGGSVVFNTFERDWTHSKKKLGTAIGTNSTAEFKGRRKYITDCYWKIDIDNNDNLTYPLDTDYFDNNWAETYVGEEGNITLWKVQ